MNEAGNEGSPLQEKDKKLQLEGSLPRLETSRYEQIFRME